MRSRLTVLLLVISTLIVGLLFGRELYRHRDLPRAQLQRKKLRVLTYSSFVGATGPGAEIIKKFETDHDCDVEVTTAGDAGLLLERVKLAEASVPFDVVLGFDQLQLPEADRQITWQSQVFASSGRHPIVAEFAHPHFVPFDWSPMTFIYRKSSGIKPPVTLGALTNSAYKNKIGLQDPRSSTPGLQFLNWIKTVYGTHTETFLRDLKPNVHSVSPSWSLAYGLFKKEQIEFVFSYVTSLAYHWGVEEDRNFQLVGFPEGHPVQVEYVGVPKSCGSCELAQDFVEDLLKPQAQKIIMEKNFMLPVIQGLEEGSVFAELPQLKVIKIETGKDLREWDEVFKK